MSGPAMLFVVLGALSLFVALWQLWLSLRGAFGAEELEVSASVQAESRRVLLEQKRALLQNLKDLRFEKEAGKVSAEDFARLDARLRSRAREVLRLLDADVEPFRKDAEDLVQRTVGAAPEPAPAGDEESVEDEVPPEESTALRCGSCGTANDTDALFCKRCATSLVPGESASGDTEEENDAAEAAGEEEA